MKNDNKKIKIMINEKKFLEIYNKYGKKKYNNYLPYMIYSDTFYETNNKFLSLYKETEYLITRRISIDILKKFLVLSTISLIILFKNTEAIISDNSVKYEQQIEKYNNHICDYAEEINQLELNDFEKIIKVMYDEWNYIEGYGNSSLDEMGFYRLGLAEQNSSGVCRNIADDVTAKLNAINPKYEAKNLIVNMECDDLTIANIDVRTSSSYDPSSGESKEYIQKLFGNHLITIAKIPDTNILLAIDTTNPSIGIYKNGKIYSFSTIDGTGYYKPILGNILFGINHYLDIQHINFESYIEESQPVSELKQEYGLDIQNKILEKIKSQ